MPRQTTTTKIIKWFRNNLRIILNLAFTLGMIYLVIWAGWKLWLGIIIGMAAICLLHIYEVPPYMTIITFFQMDEQNEKTKTTTKELGRKKS